MFVFDTQNVYVLGHTVSGKAVVEIQPSVIDKFEKKILANIPEIILLAWQSFSLELQAHILICAKVNLQNELQDLSVTQLGATVLSPLLQDAPRFPVRLPNARMKEGVSKELYDLVEILRLQVKTDGNGVRYRENPTTRDKFTLKDIKPDFAMLKEIKKRAGNLPEEKQAGQALTKGSAPA